MILNKWGIALLQFGYAVIIALQAFRTMEQNAATIWQLVAVIVGAAFTVVLPLTKGKWAAGLKVASAVAAAAFTAIIPLALQTWTLDNILIVVLAVINALAVQFGVDARIDAAKEVLTDDSKSNAAITAVDPAAARVAAKQLVADHRGLTDNG